MSFGVAMANYAGQNYGAGRMDRLRKGVKDTCIMAMCVCVVVSSILPKIYGYSGVIIVDCLAWVVACTILTVSYYFIIIRKNRL